MSSESDYSTPPPTHDKDFLLAETEAQFLAHASDDEDEGSADQPLFPTTAACGSSARQVPKAEPNPMNVVCLVKEYDDSDSEDEDVIFGSQLASLLGVGRRPTTHLEDRRRSRAEAAPTPKAPLSSRGRQTPSPPYVRAHSNRKRQRSVGTQEEEVQKVVQEAIREIQALEKIAAQQRAECRIEEVS